MASSYHPERSYIPCSTRPQSYSISAGPITDLGGTNDWEESRRGGLVSHPPSPDRLSMSYSVFEDIKSRTQPRHRFFNATQLDNILLSRYLNAILARHLHGWYPATTTTTVAPRRHNISGGYNLKKGPFVIKSHTFVFKEFIMTLKRIYWEDFFGRI